MDISIMNITEIKQYIKENYHDERPLKGDYLTNNQIDWLIQQAEERESILTKMNQFIEELYIKADMLEAIADGESLMASGGYYGKAHSHREIAILLEELLK